jgi:alpha-tubulin suppressor-like RCC1 family protein
VDAFEASSGLLDLDPVLSRLALGGSSSCGLNSAGAVQCWGDNLGGQLGVGQESLSSSPTPLTVDGLGSGARAVFGGQVSHCAVLQDGQATCWGDSIFGILQPGNMAGHFVTFSPFEAPGLAYVVSMGLGLFFHCALNQEGGVKCYGINSAGQIGNGSLSDAYTPVSVVDLEPSVSLAAAGYFACAVTAAGSVKCWGANNYGQLGNGTEQDSRTAVEVLGLPAGASFVSTGREHACAIVSGEVWCWGSGGFGQLGTGPGPNGLQAAQVPGLTGIVELASGVEHTCARSDSGGVVCWGDACAAGPVQIVDGGAVELDAGGRHSCALLTGSVLRCWGDDSSGQLGPFGGAGAPF